MIGGILPLVAGAHQTVHNGREQQEYCDHGEQNGQGDEALHFRGQFTDKIIYQDGSKHADKHTEIRNK